MMSEQPDTQSQTIWQNRWVRAALGLLAFVLVLMVALALSQVLIPLAAAFLVAYILDPVCDAIQRFLQRTVDPLRARMRIFLAPYLAPVAAKAAPVRARVAGMATTARQTVRERFQGKAGPKQKSRKRAKPVDKAALKDPARYRYRGVAVGIVVMSAIALVVLIPVVFIPALVAEMDRFVQQAREAAQEVHDDDRMPFFDRAQKFMIERLPLEEIVVTWGLREVVEMDADAPAEQVLAAFVNTYIRENALAILRNNIRSLADWGQWAGLTTVNIFSRIGQGALALVMFLLNLALFSFVAVYLLKDYDRVVGHARELLPPKHRAQVVRIASNIDAQLRSFFVGQAKVMSILAVIYSIGFLICGVPFAIVLAIIGGMLNIMPYLGPLLTYIPVIGLTWMAHGFDWRVGGAILTIFLAQALESNVLTPNIIGNEIGLHPVWVILAVIVFSGAFGFVGLLVAVPLAAALKVLVEEALEWYRKSAYYKGAAAAD